MFLNLCKEILFPVYCLDCNEEGSWLCKRCQSKLNPNYQNNKAVSYLDGLTAFFSYDDLVISKLIKVFKYNYAKDIVSILEKIIDSNKIINNWEKFAIIPIPMHSRRLCERGFNQAEIIGKIIFKKLNCQAGFLNILQKTRYTKQQAKLSGRQRRENLVDSFKVKNNFDVPKNILLVDDVYTTGSTMQECTKVLKEKGAEYVWGIVLAKG